jgi:phospholipid-binding lipoprotein MlaA
MSARTRGAALGVLAAALLLSGCTTLNIGAKSPGQRLDPWENWNRGVFRFNEKLDEKVLKPVATVYTEVIPRPIREGVNNFFGNAADAWSAVNNLLQGKLENGLADIIRVGTNTIFGLGGVLDVATEFGIDHQYEDFGQTLGHWGIGPGAYIVWPVLGPSSVRESFAMPLDRSVSPALVINDGAVRWEITGLQIISTRASLLGASRVVDDIALDKYTFVRDAYLQRRRSLVYDGDAPEPAAPPADAGAAPAGAASAPAAGASAPAPAPAASAAPAK